MHRKTEHTKIIRWIKYLFLFLCLVLGLVGFLKNEYALIFANADNLCYSCMGLE
jgi:nitrate/TMAO reductase-like tetraheme cytochrome c subunit